MATRQEIREIDRMLAREGVEMSKLTPRLRKIYRLAAQLNDAQAEEVALFLEQLTGRESKVTGHN